MKERDLELITEKTIDPNILKRTLNKLIPLTALVFFGLILPTEMRIKVLDTNCDRKVSESEIEDFYDKSGIDYSKAVNRLNPILDYRVGFEYRDS